MSTLAQETHFGRGEPEDPLNGYMGRVQAIEAAKENV